MKLKSTISEVMRMRSEWAPAPALCVRVALILLTFFLSTPAHAQFYNFGTDPSSVSWRQINSEHFKLVYPEEIDSLAREYLRTMEKYRPLVNEPIGIDPNPIPVILHPYTTISNGMVAWCPKGMHLITSPNPYSDTQIDWMTQLCTHELRHVAQTEHFTRGFYKWIYPLLGESITGIGMALFANTAYLEGDAVMSETMLTPGGRGRMASFLMQLRADYLEGFYRNVEGHLLASYHYKPYDKYAVGFMAMTSETMRSKNYFYPTDFYKVNALNLGGYTMRRSKRPFTEYDENFALMQKTVTKVWKDDLERRGKLTCAERLTDSTRLYCDYYGAMYIKDTLSPLYGSIVALKKGMEYTNELVRISPDGKETHLRYHATHSSKMSDDDFGRLYWSESVMHDPSSAETFSEIKYYDVRKDELGTLTFGTKYFSPSVCDCGHHMAVAEYPVGKPSRLAIISTESGDEIASVPSPGNGQIQETVFCGDNIYTTVVNERGVALWRIDEYEVMAGRPSWIEVLPAQGCELRNIRKYRGGVCFASDLDGVLNIYSYDEKSGALTRLTNSKYGANYPFVADGGGDLFFSEYDRMGYHLVRCIADSLENVQVKWEEFYEPPYVTALTRQRDAQSKAAAADDPSYIDPEKYPSKPYNKFLNSFKIHTWAPIYYNADRILNMSGDNLYDYASLGAVAYSQNDLGTVQTMLGYSYHKGFHSGHAKILSVIADFDVEAAFDINDRHRISYTRDSKSYKGKYEDKPYCSFELTVDYPFNLYGGGWSSMLIPSISWSLSNDVFHSSDKTYQDRTANIGCRYYRMLSTATSAVYPRWGFSVSAYHSFSLNSLEKMPLSYFGGYAYLPGITRSQGLKLSLQAQYRHSPTGSLYYNNSYASMPRGYSEEFALMPSRQYAKLSADYAIPIWLGDLTIPYILYFKRLQLIPFADFARERNFSGGVSSYWSAGSDLTVHFSVLRFRFEANCGVRFAYTGPQGDLSRQSWSFLFGIKI